MNVPAQTVAAPKTLGAIDCPCCGEDLPVKQNGRDTLNISCPWCGVSSYAKGGTQAHGIIMKWLRKTTPQAETVAEAAPSAKPAPSPLAKIARGFQLGEV